MLQTKTKGKLHTALVTLGALPILHTAQIDIGHRVTSGFVTHYAKLGSKLCQDYAKPKKLRVY